LAVERLEERNLLDARTFVIGLYSNLLQRAPAEAEVQSWLNQLDDGTDDDDREEVVEGFVESTEFRTNLITDKYQTLLGRAPDPTGFNAFLGFLRAGGDEREIDVTILSSPEYFQRNGGDNTGFLTAVYRDVLGRAIDPSGQAFWGSLLQAGRPRDEVARAILESAENGARVVDGVFALFGVSGDQQDDDFQEDREELIDEFRDGDRSRSDLIVDVGSSEEVARQFGIEDD
jgi:hypothetical protein